jgi:O-antigen/teichoic acid export membrane protein
VVDVPPSVAVRGAGAPARAPLLSSAAWNAAATLGSMVVMFFLSPFLIRRIGTDAYGLYLLLLSLTGILGVLNLGLGEATLRYAAFFHARADIAGVNRVLGATLAIYLIMGAAGAATLLAGAHFLSALFRIPEHDRHLSILLIRLTALSFAVRLVAAPHGAIPQAAMRFDVASVLALAETVLRALGSVVAVWIGYGLVGLVAWGALLSALVLVANVAVATTLVSGVRVWPGVSREGLREVFGYGVFVLAGQLFGLAWQYADRVILGAFVGTGAVALFAVPHELVFRVLALAGAGAAVLMPRFAGTQSEGDMTSLYLRSTAVFISLSVTLFVPFTVLVRDFLRLWISPDFAASAGPVAMLIAGSCLVRGAFLPYESLFRGIGRPQYYLFLVVLTSSTIVLLDLLLIPAYGLAGAGYSLCASPLWGLLAIVLTWRLLLRQKDYSVLVRVVLVPLALGFVCLALFFFLRRSLPPVLGWGGLFAVGAVMTAATASLLAVYERFCGLRTRPIRQVLRQSRQIVLGWK